MNDEVRLGYTHAFTKKSHIQLSYGLENDYERLDGMTYDLSRRETGHFVLGALPEGYEWMRWIVCVQEVIVVPLDIIFHFVTTIRMKFGEWWQVWT